MSDFERNVFDLKVLGLEYKEIAALLDKSYKSVDSALQRIRGKVKKVLDEYNRWFELVFIYSVNIYKIQLFLIDL